MAICHISASVVKRSAGHSAVAAAAYRAGEKLVDERTGDVHDYSRRRGVNAAEILAPPGAPAWALNRETLWNRAESAERRSDSQVAREIRVAIPIELSRDAGRDLVRDYVQREFVDRGMVADIAWHDEDGRNPHAHILLTMRQIEHEDFGKKVRTWNDKKTLAGWREAWADSTNQALKVHGSTERIDHRTLAAQRVDAEARGNRDAALRLDRPPTVHRGRTLTHHPGAAPDRHLRFADAEAERAIAIGVAEDTIQLESFVAGEAAAQKRLVREIDEAIHDAIDAIPEETRAEGLAHAAQSPRALPTPPTIERDVLTAEFLRRLLDAIPEETRAEGLAHAAQSPRALPTPPTIERDVLTAEFLRRLLDAIPEETRAEGLAHAAQSPRALPTPPTIERDVLTAEFLRRLLDAIPEETRAEGLAHAAQSPRALPTPPTIERDVLTAEATRREETRAAAKAAETLKNEQAAAAEAARRAKTRFELVQSRVMVDARHAAAELTHDWRPAPTRALCLAAQKALTEHAAGDRYAATPQVAGAPLAVGQLRQDLELEILDVLDVPKPRGARIPPPEPETVAKLVQKVQDLADRRIRHAAMEEGLELPAAAVTDTPSVTVTDTPSVTADTPSVTDTPTPPRAQGTEVKRPSAVDGMPGEAAQPKPDRTGGRER